MSQSLLLHRFRGQDRPQLTARSLPTHLCSAGFSSRFQPPFAKTTAIIGVGIPDIEPCWGFCFCSLGSSGSRQTVVVRARPPQPAPLWLARHVSFLWEAGSLWENALLWGLQLCEHRPTPALPPSPDNSHIVRQGAFPLILGPCGSGGAGGGAGRCHAWLEWMPHD